MYRKATRPQDVNCEKKNTTDWYTNIVINISLVKSKVIYLHKTAKIFDM